MQTDRELVQIVDAAMAEAVRKSGSWLACRPGCYQCCIGPFPITALDAQRLRRSLVDLEARDSGRAAAVRRRASSSVERLRQEYPQDTVASVIAAEDPAEHELCPALDPDLGLCDLYEARPLTCRTFGPAVRFGFGAESAGPVGVCELCYQGATDEQIAACQVTIDQENVEALLSEAVNEEETLVAFALAAEIGLQSL